MLPMILASYIDDTGVAGSAAVAAGRCWFVPPISGKIRSVRLCAVGDTGVERDIYVRTAHAQLDYAPGVGKGIGAMPDNGGTEAPVKIEMSMFRPEGHMVYAGEAFAIESEGNGGNVNITGVVVEIGP